MVEASCGLQCREHAHEWLQNSIKENQRMFSRIRTSALMAFAVMMALPLAASFGQEEPLAGKQKQDKPKEGNDRQDEGRGQRGDRGGRRRGGPGGAGGFMDPQQQTEQL